MAKDDISGDVDYAFDRVAHILRLARGISLGFYLHLKKDAGANKKKWQNRDDQNEAAKPKQPNRGGQTEAAKRWQQMAKSDGKVKWQKSEGKSHMAKVRWQGQMAADSKDGWQGQKAANGSR